MSAGGPADCCHIRRDQAIQFHAAELRRAFAKKMPARRQKIPYVRLQRTGLKGPLQYRTAVRVHLQIAVSDRRAVIRCRYQIVAPAPPGRGRRQAELPAGPGYLAAPAMYAATIYVACRSRLPRARSYRIVVLGSACEAASWTSRSGTPASSAAVMNACLSV